MPAGFEVYNADGTLQFSTNHRIMRGLQSFATGRADGSATVPGASTGTVLIIAPRGAPNLLPPTVTFGSGTLSWSWPSGVATSGRVGGDIYVVVY